jgi:hypothetical protein
LNDYGRNRRAFCSKTSVIERGVLSQMAFVPIQITIYCPIPLIARVNNLKRNQLYLIKYEVKYGSKELE